MDKPASRKTSSKTSRPKWASKNSSAESGDIGAKEAPPRKAPSVGGCRIKRGNAALAATSAIGKRRKAHSEPMRPARAAAASAEKKNQTILSLEVQEENSRGRPASASRGAKIRWDRARGHQKTEGNSEFAMTAKEDETNVSEDPGESGQSSAADPVWSRRRDKVVDKRPGGRNAAKGRKTPPQRKGNEASGQEYRGKSQGREKDANYKRKTEGRGSRDGGGPRKRRGRPLANQSRSSSEENAAEAKDMPTRKKSRGAPSPGAKKAAGKTAARNGKEENTQSSLLLRRSTRGIFFPEDDPPVENHAQEKEKQLEGEGDGAMEEEGPMDVQAPMDLEAPHPEVAPGETAYHHFLAEKREETSKELKEEAKANGNQEITIQDLFVAVHKKYCSLDRATRNAYKRSWRMAQKNDKESS